MATPNQEVQVGKAVLYGITNDGTAITISGFGGFILDTAKGQHKFKLDEIKDELEFDATLIASNPFLEIDLQFTPAGPTGTNTRAGAAGVAVFLTPLAKVTLAHFKVGAFNGDWIYVGDESIDLSHGVAKLTLKIRKYDNTDQNTALTGTPIAG